MNLKHVLGDIQPDRANLHLDGSPHVIRLQRSLYGTSMPGAGAVHHIKSRLMRCNQRFVALHQSWIIPKAYIRRLALPKSTMLLMRSRVRGIVIK